MSNCLYTGNRFLLFLCMCLFFSCIPGQVENYEAEKKVMRSFLPDREVTSAQNNAEHDSIIFNQLRHIGEEKLFSLGNTRIFKTYTNGSYEAIKFHSWFFFGEEKQVGYLSVEDSIFFVRTRPDDPHAYVATFNNLLDKSVQIHHYTNGSFSKVFDSYDDSGYLSAIPLTSYEWEDGDVLLGKIISDIRFENIDINGDGWLDIKFSGIVTAPDYNLYNMGINSVQVEMIFLYDPEASLPRWYRYVPDEIKAMPLYDRFHYENEKKYIEEELGLEYSILNPLFLQLL